MKTTVSLSDLKILMACPDQLERFEKLFGQRPVEVTPELCDLHWNEFDFEWAAFHMLTPSGYTRYRRLIAPTERVLDWIRTQLPSAAESRAIEQRRRVSHYHQVHVSALAFGTTVFERGLADRNEGEFTCYEYYVVFGAWKA